MGNKRKNRRLRLLREANERQMNMIPLPHRVNGKFASRKKADDDKPVEVSPQMLKMIRDATMGVGWADEPSDKLITYGLAKDGLYLMKSSNIGEVSLKIASISPELPNAPKMIEDYTPAFPKLPWSVFAPAINFLRAVKEKYDTEGLVRFYYHPERGWYAYVPTQVVSAASVNVAQTEPDQDGIFAVEIHSHPGGSSVFSGVDDAHEQMDRVFLCVAFPDKSSPNFHARVGTGSKRWLNISLDEIVEMEEVLNLRVSPLALLTSNGDRFPYLPYPAEWLEKVSKENYATGSRWNGTTYHGPQHVPGFNPDGFRVTDHRRLVAPSSLLENDWVARKQAREREEELENEKVAKWLKERAEAGDLIDGEVIDAINELNNN